MARWMMAVGLLVALVLLPGCNPGPKILPSGEVGGTVNLDGKPLPEGEITFSAPGEVPNSMPIKDGDFEGKAKAGDVKVSIAVYKVGEPIMMDGKPVGDPVRTNILPVRFNTETRLKATIPATSTKDLKFDVESK